MAAKTLTAKTITSTTGDQIEKVLSREKGKAVVRLTDKKVYHLTQGDGRIEVGDWRLADGTHILAEQASKMFTVS